MSNISNSSTRSLAIIKIGDLVHFKWPHDNDRIGLVIDIFYRSGDYVDDEIYVLSESERWSVPAKWCKLAY